MPYKRKSRKSHKSRISREMRSLFRDLVISLIRGKFGQYPSGEPQDNVNNNGWVLGLDIMYLFSTHFESRWQAFPRFPEPISLYVLHFLSRFNCILRSEDPAPNSRLVKELESYKPYFEGWYDKIDDEVWAAIKKSLGRRGEREVQRYKSGSPFKELLHFVRNTWAHITDLKLSKEILKKNPKGFCSYINEKFPVLLMIAYRVAYKFCREEDWFEEFLPCDDTCSGILEYDWKFLRTYVRKRSKSLSTMAREVTN